MGGEDDQNDIDRSIPSPNVCSSLSSLTELESDDESYFTGGVTRITIIDDKKSKDYHVHQRLLRENTPYFAALPNFREGAENHITLSHINHKAFTQISHWLYDGKFRSSLGFDGLHLNTWISVWVAADRLMMGKCKNMAMDELRRRLRHRTVSPWNLRKVCDLGYSPDSTLARYLMDQIAYDCTTDRLRKDDSIVHEIEPTDPEIASALTKRIIITARAWSWSKVKGGSGPEDPAALVGCYYHEHIEGETCYLT